MCVLGVGGHALSAVSSSCSQKFLEPRPHHLLISQEKLPLASQNPVDPRDTGGKTGCCPALCACIAIQKYLFKIKKPKSLKGEVPVSKEGGARPGSVHPEKLKPYARGPEQEQRSAIKPCAGLPGASRLHLQG